MVDKYQGRVSMKIPIGSLTKNTEEMSKKTDKLELVETPCATVFCFRIPRTGFGIIYNSDKNSYDLTHEQSDWGKTWLSESEIAMWTARAKEEAENLTRWYPRDLGTFGLTKSYKILSFIYNCNGEKIKDGVIHVSDEDGRIANFVRKKDRKTVNLVYHDYADYIEMRDMAEIWRRLTEATCTAPLLFVKD